MHAERQARRLRRIVLAAAGVTLTPAAAWLWGGDIGRGARWFLWAWFHGYEGCACPDCTWALAGVIADPLNTQARVPGLPDLGFGERDELGLRAAAYGVCLLLLGVFGRPVFRRLAALATADPSRCAACGSPRTGLPAGAPCPECGGRPPSGRAG